MSDSNVTSNSGPPYKESGFIAGVEVKGTVRVDEQGRIFVTEDDGRVTELGALFRRFRLPQRLVIDISTEHRESELSGKLIP